MRKCMWCPKKLTPYLPNGRKRRSDAKFCSTACQQGPYQSDEDNRKRHNERRRAKRKRTPVHANGVTMLVAGGGDRGQIMLYHTKSRKIIAELYVDRNKRLQTVYSPRGKSVEVFTAMRDRVNVAECLREADMYKRFKIVGGVNG